MTVLVDCDRLLETRRRPEPQEELADRTRMED